MWRRLAGRDRGSAARRREAMSAPVGGSRRRIAEQDQGREEGDVQGRVTGRGGSRELPRVSPRCVRGLRRIPRRGGRGSRSSRSPWAAGGQNPSPTNSPKAMLHSTRSPRGPGPLWRLPKPSRAGTRTAWGQILNATAPGRPRPRVPAAPATSPHHRGQGFGERRRASRVQRRSRNRC